MKIFIIVGMPAAGKHLARTDNYILNTGSMADAMASLNAIAKRW